MLKKNMEPSRKRKEVDTDREPAAKVPKEDNTPISDDAEQKAPAKRGRRCLVLPPSKLEAPHWEAHGGQGKILDNMYRWIGCEDIQLVPFFDTDPPFIPSPPSKRPLRLTLYCDESGWYKPDPRANRWVPKLRAGPITGVIVVTLTDDETGDDAGFSSKQDTDALLAYLENLE